MNRRTKIAATIGPSSQDISIITDMIKAGMNVARLNFSHGTHEEHAVLIQRLRSTAQELSLPLSIMQDLQGPKIRVGEIKNGSTQLISGEQLILTNHPIQGDNTAIPVDLPQLPEMVNSGDRILLDDGKMELIVLTADKDEIHTRVVTGGELKTHKGINLPGKRLDIPSLSEKDIEDLAFGLELNIDMIALSYVRSLEDLSNLRQVIARINPDRNNTPIIAKIERPEALENLDAIIAASDGVIVARGDLGVEMPPASVPIAQKNIISSANKLGKTVIIATQLLDSMVYNTRPTRAEASDIANAIFDGTDAVLLTGETASGNYPILVIQTMNAIICEAETHASEWGHFTTPQSQYFPSDDAFFIAQAAYELARDRNVAAIAVFTKTGRTAQLLAKTRPGVDIIAFTPNQDVYRQLSLVWGVIPYTVPYVETVEQMIDVVDKTLIASTTYKPGQQVVLVCGYPVKNIQPANMTIIHTIGEK